MAVQCVYIKWQCLRAPISPQSQAVQSAALTTVPEIHTQQEDAAHYIASRSQIWQI